MEEIIEGCFKVFFGLLFILAAPVIALYYLFLGIRWLLKEIGMWWATNGTHVMVGLAWMLIAVVLVAIVCGLWPWFCHWYELRQVRIRAERAIQRTNTHYEKTRAEMEQLARAHHLRKGISQ